MHVPGKPYMRVLIPMVVALTGAALLPGVAAAAGAKPYRLLNKHSGKCVDLAGSSTASQANIEQQACDGTISQDFKLEHAGPGYYRLVNRYSGKCVDVAGGSTDAGANVWQYHCNGTPAQEFTLEPLGAGTDTDYYRLANRKSGKCLDVANAGTTDGTNIQQWWCNGHDAQAFYIYFPEDGLAPPRGGYLPKSLSYPDGTGDIPIHRFKAFQINDRAELKVNLVTGNLMLQTTDLNAAGTRLPLVLARTWNSLDPDTPTELGRGWRFNLGSDVNLSDCSSAASPGPDAHLPGGLKVKFPRKVDGSYTPPTGMRVDVTQTADSGCAGDAFTLTDRVSKLKSSFGGPSDAERVLTRLQDRHGNRISVAYAGADMTASVTDTRDRAVTFVREAVPNADANDITGLRDWTGRSTAHAYDSSGRLASAIDLAGHQTTFGYDASNRLTSITDPNLNVITIVYDDRDRVFSITRGGLKWTFDYQNGSPSCANHRLPLTAEAVGQTVVIDPRSTDPKASPDDTAWSGPFTNYCYDVEGRVRRAYGPLFNNAVTDYDVDEDSNLTSVGWSESKSRRSFDQDRVRSVRSATGATERYEYGDLAHPLLPTRRLNSLNIVEDDYSYDAAGNIKTITDAHSKQLKYDYNSDGTLASSTDQLGRTTRYEYDAVGRLTGTYPASGKVRPTLFFYDDAGRVRRIDRGGHETDYRYDAMDRVKEVMRDDGYVYAYAYDGNGNVRYRKESHTECCVYTFYEHDALNRLTVEDPGYGNTTNQERIAYGYDKLGNLTSVRDGGGTTRYEYGYGNHVEKVIEPDGATTTYQVDSNPEMPTKSYHPMAPPKVTYPNGVTVTNESDLSGRLTSTIARNAAGSVLFHRSYRYQLIGSTYDTHLIQEETDHRAGTRTDYDYDSVGRLLKARRTRLGDGSLTSEHRYTYDAAGNRAQRVVDGTTTLEESNDADQLIKAGSTTFGYDPRGDLTSTSAGFSATYNVAGQAEHMSRGGQNVSTSYAGPGQSEMTKLGGDTIQNTAVGITRVGGDRFTRGPDGRLVAMRTAEGESHYYLTDARGSVVALTASNGFPTQFFYDGPFGSRGPISGSASAQRNPFRFTGALYSKELGLYKMGEGWYDPETGRCTQPGSVDSEDRNNACAVEDPVNTSALGALGWFKNRFGVGGFCGLAAAVSPPLILTPILEVYGADLLPFDFYIDALFIGYTGFKIGGYAARLCERLKRTRFFRTRVLAADERINRGPLDALERVVKQRQQNQNAADSRVPGSVPDGRDVGFGTDEPHGYMTGCT